MCFNLELDLTWFIVSDEVEPLLPHLHPGDAFSRQVGVDGGELATDGAEVDDLLDGRPHLLHALNLLVAQNSVNGILALVTSGRAVSAVFQYLQCDIDLQFHPHQCLISHEEESLTRQHCVPVDQSKLHRPALGGQ